MDFVCNKCGKCCKDRGFSRGIVVIYPQEVIKISNYLNISEKDFVLNYCKKDYVKIGKVKYDILLLKSQNKQCIFLNNNLCDIYDSRPIQCKRAPFEYFAQKRIWKNLPCLENIDYKDIDTKEEDLKLMKDLMKGYTYSK